MQVYNCGPRNSIVNMPATFDPTKNSQCNKLIYVRTRREIIHWRVYSPDTLMTLGSPLRIANSDGCGVRRSSLTRGSLVAGAGFEPATFGL